MNAKLLAICASAVLAIGVRASLIYHDFGATTGQESTGNVTTHQSGGSGASANPLDASLKNLIDYADGSATGYMFQVTGANGMDSRNSGQTAPPAGGTPADALFNVPGLNLNNGMIYEGGTGGSGATTFQLSGLDPSSRYDVALYGHRSAGADGVERFTLGGAEAAINSSSTGVIGTLLTDMQTRPNATAGHVVRWTDVRPGADGTFTIDVDPEVSSANNIAYLSALRLESSTATNIAQVDFNHTASGPTQSGWDGWNVNQPSGAVLNINNTFAASYASDGTLDVSLSTTTSGISREYGLDLVTDPVNLTNPNVWSDQVFFNNNAGGDMTLTFNDLLAGDYLFTSFHYADNLRDVPENDEGVANVFLNGVDTGIDQAFVVGQLSSVVGGPVTAADLQSLGTLNLAFTVANDNDPVSILFDNLFDGDSFGINGFQLAYLPSAAPIPEPGTWALLALTMLGLGYGARRRRQA